MIDQKYSSLNQLLSAQLQSTPEQEPFFQRQFSGLPEEHIKFLDEMAYHISRLIGTEIAKFTQDYGWVCAQMLDEELYFRRHKRYRRSTFKEAYRDVYSDDQYMARYLNGLLMTQLWWSNHSNIFRFYRDAFLAKNRHDSRHLEIGPGHGLFIYFAASDPKTKTVEGWDISPAAIESTTSALKVLGLTNLPQLKQKDLFANPAGSFDSIVFSEILEHLDRPEEALSVLRSLCAKNARLFINMPINSPAPDHIFNLPTPEAFERFISDAGFKILDRAFHAATNQSLELARKKQLTISCAVIAEPAYSARRNWKSGADVLSAN